MAELLSASQAAAVIGCGPQMVRERMKRGIWSFGTVVTAKQSGNIKNTYEIHKRDFAKWLGISLDELEEILRKEDKL